MMAITLDWVRFLNESATWEKQSQGEAFFSALCGREVRFNDSDLQNVSDTETFLREQLSALHLGKELDVVTLNKRLERMTLRLIHKEENPSKLSLPRLRTWCPGTEPAVFEIVDTFLFQFACFISDTVDGASSVNVFRCEGLCHKDSVADCKKYYERFASLEKSWKSEVLPDLAMAGELERCSDFFLAAPGAKFCSDSCRFSTFAFRKKMQSPDYQAAKQKRYRERKKLERNKG